MLAAQSSLEGCVRGLSHSHVHCRLPSLLLHPSSSSPPTRLPQPTCTFRNGWMRKVTVDVALLLLLLLPLLLYCCYYYCSSAVEAAATAAVLLLVERLGVLLLLALLLLPWQFPLHAFYLPIMNCFSKVPTSSSSFVVFSCVTGSARCLYTVSTLRPCSCLCLFCWRDGYWWKDFCPSYAIRNFSW